MTLKKFILSNAILALHIGIVLINPMELSAQEICGTMHNRDQLVIMHPELDSIYGLQDEILLDSTYLNKNVVTIPVVFHVIYNTPSQQVSMTILNQAIDILSRDFRRQNPDASFTGYYGGYANPNGLWANNHNNVAADCEIQFEFCGVTYDYTPYFSIDLSQNAYFLKDNYPYYQTYPPANYLNVWVCNLSGGLLGLAEFPGSPADQDGVSITYSALGYNSTDNRVLTHEVGHWLGLRHIWGDCFCCDDFVNDTYPQQADNSTMAAQPPFPTYPNQYPCATWTACPGMNIWGGVNYPYANMGDNYMDYSPSSCMNFFSLGQKQRMWYFLNNYRSGLFSNIDCDVSLEENLFAHNSIFIFPSPTKDVINIENIESGTAVVITDLLGQKIIETVSSDNLTQIDVSSLSNGIYLLNGMRFVKN